MDKNEELTNSFKFFLKLMGGLIIIFSIIIYLFELNEKALFDFEDKNMTEAFFYKHQETLDKYGINYIKNYQIAARGYYADYELDTVNKMNLKHVSIPQTTKYSELYCPTGISILMNNETKTLKFDSNDLKEFGKQKLFELTEKCLEGTIIGIEYYIAQEKRYNEEFKLKEEK